MIRAANGRGASAFAHAARTRVDRLTRIRDMVAIATGNKLISVVLVQSLRATPLQTNTNIMRIDAIAIGNNPPEDVNVIIEVPHGGQPIKYEMDKEAGTLVVDRFLYTPMAYPGNYGFVPHTLSEDGDPIDVLVANSRELVPGCLINVRPIGVLVMEDNAGQDEKILAVPSPALTQPAWATRPPAKAASPFASDLARKRKHHLPGSFHSRPN